MANNNLEDLYHPIFEKIYPQIKTQRRGVLYHVIYEILSTDKEQADAICNQYGIKSSATLDEDNKIVNEITPHLKKGTDMLGFKIPNFVNTIAAGLKDKERFGIVATACKLAGPLLCENYLNSVEEQQIQAGGKKRTNLPRPPLTVALCLIVPASVASSLQNEMVLKTFDIEQLIDAASYFLCTEVQKADKLYLETTDKEILSDSNLEVYMRIDIPNGQEMIDKTIRYILKRNLPPNGQGKIKELACLKSLSGLEVFNRV